MRAILLICMLWLPTLALADESNLWFDTGFWTRHQIEPKECGHGGGCYRQNNTGYGLEYTLSKSTSFHLGEYQNSLFHNATYAAYAYQPLKFGPTKTGIAFTVATGYTQGANRVAIRHDHPGFDTIFVPLPMMSMEGKHVGLNLIYLPTVMASLQLKVRF